jgi:hypothetical protein
MPRWSQVPVVRQIEPLLRSHWARPTAALLVLLCVMPVAAMAPSSDISADGRALTGRIQLPYPFASTSLPATHRPECFREFARQTIFFVSGI